MVVVVPQIEQKKHVDGSFVKVSSVDITKKAHESLKVIERQKKRQIQDLITRLRKERNEEIEKKKSSLWSRLFGYKEIPEPNDEQILKSYECSGEGIWMPETFFIDLSWEKYIDVAYRLINAAKYADEIFVSTEDLEKLL